MGQQEIHLRLSRILTSLGITVVLVYADLPSTIEHRLRDVGAAVERVSYANGPSHYYRELGRIIRRYSVSLVHICYFDYFSSIPWLTRLQGVKRILYEELNSGRLHARSWKKLLLRVRTSVMTFPMSRVIAVSEFVRRDCINRGIRGDRIVVRYLAADEQVFRPDPAARALWANKYAVKPGELIMSTVTLLRPFKSPETLVHASEVLARRGLPARLFVAGDGDMLPALRHLSERLGVSDRIHWLGFCSDPSTLMQASDIFLLASIDEAGAFVLSEAMLCGVPVIGSRSGVQPEYIQDGTTGLLATPRDPMSFADAIEMLGKNESLRHSMAIRSREIALQRFTVDIHVAATLRIYESLLSG